LSRDEEIVALPKQSRERLNCERMLRRFALDAAQPDIGVEQVGCHQS
jgi:hypothetical protein